MQKNIDAVKEWLDRYRQCMVDIDYLNTRAELLKERASSPQSTAIDGMPHTKGGIKDRMAENIAIVTDIEKQISDIYKKAVSIREEITLYANMLKGRGAADMKCVILTRYIDLLKWDDINDILWLKKEDYIEREDSYRRRTFKIYHNALKELSFLVTKKTIQENNAERVKFKND